MKMECNFLYLFLNILFAQTVLSSPTEKQNQFSSKKDTGLATKSPQFSCKKIKCPPIDRPACARIKYKDVKHSNRVFYVMMVNKCEINYMKCHKELEATVVPLKYCDHGISENKGTTPSLRRPKRSVQHKNRKYENELPTKVHAYGLLGDKQLLKDEDSPSVADVVMPSGKPTVLDASNVQTVEANPDSKPDTGGDGEIDASDVKTVEVDQDGKPNDGGEGDIDASEIKTAEVDQDGKPTTQDADGIDVSEIKTAEVEGGQPNQPGDQQTTEGPVTDNGDNDIDDGKDVTVNLKEYFAECPKRCPARDVMLCARCVHGIYRTFVSFCHMRMFNCRHKEEKLELISREPCLMSAPYLKGLGAPQGRVQEPHDEDPVLKYFHNLEKEKAHMRPESRENLASTMICRLPKDEGDPACNQNVVRYFYDIHQKSCEPFYYTGCLGNRNRFHTEELCLKACRLPSTIPVPT